MLRKTKGAAGGAKHNFVRFTRFRCCYDLAIHVINHCETAKFGC